MKQFLILIIAIICSTTAFAQDKKNRPLKLDKTKEVQLVEAACGQCRFGLKTQKGCDLAVRINKQAYFVDGTSIDKHGDAHAEDGFCNAVRKANVQGEIKNDRFVVTYFKLAPDSTKR